MSFRYIQVRKKRRHSVTATEILDRLDRYIDDHDDQPMRLLATHWRDQQDALSYREIREAILFEGVSTSLVRDWTEDYSRFVVDKMAPVWRDAMAAGSKGQPIMDKIQQSLRFDMNGPQMLNWIDERGAAFVVDTTEQQVQALRSMIRQYMYEKYDYDELSKVIRPCIGLTDGQSRAVLRYYESLKANMRDQHPRMRQENLEDKCLTKALRYAERMHRERARTIARTEMAFAYNHGMHESVRQAMEQGLLGTMEKRWLTSGNENVCPTCDALNGVQIAFDAPFDFGKHRHLFDGQEEAPPAHPRCACACEYIEVSHPVFS